MKEKLDLSNSLFLDDGTEVEMLKQNYRTAEHSRFGAEHIVLVKRCGRSTVEYIDDYGVPIAQMYTTEQRWHVSNKRSYWLVLLQSANGALDVCSDRHETKIEAEAAAKLYVTDCLSVAVAEVKLEPITQKLSTIEAAAKHAENPVQDKKAIDGYYNNVNKPKVKDIIDNVPRQWQLKVAVGGPKSCEYTLRYYGLSEINNQLNAVISKLAIADGAKILCIEPME